MPTIDSRAGQVAAHFDMVPDTIVDVTVQTSPGSATAASLGDVEIIAAVATAPIWYTLDGSAPTARGPRCYVIPEAPAVDTRSLLDIDGDAVVRLLTTGTATVSIQRVVG